MYYDITDKRETARYNILVILNLLCPRVHLTFIFYISATVDQTGFESNRKSNQHASRRPTRKYSYAAFTVCQWTNIMKTFYNLKQLLYKLFVIEPVWILSQDSS